MALDRFLPRGTSDRARLRRRLSLSIAVGLATTGLALLAAQGVLATAPSASFTAPSTLRIGQTGTFTSTTPDPDADGDSIVSTQWGFGDGTTGSGTSVNHAFAHAGTRTVTMTVTDSAAAPETATATRTVTVTDSAPRPSFVAAPNPARPNQTVSFDASGSSDPDPGDTITDYEWDLNGDGSFETDNGADATISRSYATAGARDIGLRVTDDNGTSATTTVRLLVNTPPVADLRVSSGVRTSPRDGATVADVGDTVAFDGSHSTDAEGPLAKFEWDLDGNGSFETDTGTTATVANVYASRGPRTVKLRVTDGLGGTAIASFPLRINAKPVAKGVAAALNPAPGQNVLVPLVGQQVALASTSTDEESTNPPANNNSIATYQWVDAGGPFGGNNAAVIHPAYTSAGDKVIALRTTDNDGAIGDGVVTVTVNTPPVADFLFSPQTPLKNETVTFSQAASDPDVGKSLLNPAIGQLTKYEWDLNGDGRFDDATGPSATTSFAAAGDHAVGLRVTDGGGATKTITRAVHVTNTRPTAAFAAGPAFPLPGQAVAFTSSSTPTAGESITKLEWDFDYNPATDSFAASDVDAQGASVSHAFDSPGQKTIGLRVTETGGGVDIQTRTVTVNAPPQASFSAAPGTPLAGDQVTFSSTSSDPDGPITQAWDTDNDGQFDDGTGAVASRAFALPGSYTVRLRVTDDRGASAIHSGLVNVAARPLPPRPRLLALPSTVQIAGRSTRTGATISRLSVRAPAGSRVTATCKGKSCPRRAKPVVVGRKLVRLARFERRLHAGVVITVVVTKRGFIGRYVTFTIRRHAAPKRSDRCLRPGARRPSACP